MGLLKCVKWQLTLRNKMILKDNTIQHIHFLGIGGIGMSALAEILLKKGYRVSGSDTTPNKNTERLKKLGIEIIYNHNSTSVAEADLVVYSSAISATNPEFLLAQQKNIPIYSRGKLLAELMLDYFSIAVAGAHGKTTTSALIAHTFTQAGCNPTYLVGGLLNSTQSPVKMGDGQYFIAEADESDASFLLMRPNIIVITNIDADHLETYEGNFNLLKKAYLDFLQHLPENGIAILCKDDPVSAELISQLQKPYVTFGFDPHSDYRVSHYLQEGLRGHFQIQSQRFKNPIEIDLNIPGKHNALNAAAVVALCDHLNLDSTEWLAAFSTFQGVDRRFQMHGTMPVKGGGAIVLEDYGHHPHEIRVTLDAIRSAWPKHRVVLVFQPHRYTRTRDFLHDFATVLKEADVLVLLEIYSASEEPIEGINSERLLAEVKKQSKGEHYYLSSLKALPNALKDIVQNGDIVVLQGAGDVGSKAPLLVEAHETD